MSKEYTTNEAPGARGVTSRYKVHVRFKNPAWDEIDGFDVYVDAYNKADACRWSRQAVRDAGHTGVLYFTATKT